MVPPVFRLAPFLIGCCLTPGPVSRLWIRLKARLGRIAEARGHAGQHQPCNTPEAEKEQSAVPSLCPEMSWQTSVGSVLN